jgi:hypothetical protein
LNEVVRISSADVQLLNALSATLVERYGRFPTGPLTRWVSPELRCFIGVPTTNLGPCGPISLAFLEEWTRHATRPATFAYFLLADDPSECRHVVTRIGDDQFFDGGDGVVDRATLIERQHRLGLDGFIETTEQVDLDLLAHRSGGLHRQYQWCPDFSPEWVRATIRTHLDRAAEPPAEPRSGTRGNS